jgi:hypothetical protein
MSSLWRLSFLRRTFLAAIIITAFASVGAAGAAEDTAIQGNAQAQNNLGVAYAKGEGVPQDYAEAAKWYRLAADQGNAQTQNNLDTIYGRRFGVPHNAKAVQWYQLAAHQGASGQDRPQPGTSDARGGKGASSYREVYDTSRTLARAKLQKGDMGGAIEAANHAFNQLPDHTVVTFVPICGGVTATVTDVNGGYKGTFGLNPDQFEQILSKGDYEDLLRRGIVDTIKTYSVVGNAEEAARVPCKRL